MQVQKRQKWSMRFLVGLMACALAMSFAVTGAFAAEKIPLAVVSPQDLKNLFWFNWVEGYKEACKQLGMPSLAVDGQGEESAQLHGIEDTIVKGAKFLMVSPVGGVMCRTVIEKCEEAKVHSTVWSGMNPEQLPPDKFEYYTGWVSNYAIPQGHLLAEELFKKLGGKGKIVAIHGVPG